MLFGGIEGGTSNSRIVILDECGSLVSTAEGPHTNQWLLGMEETVRRLVQLIEAALGRAVSSQEKQLTHLCMALSGVDTEETKNDLITALNAVRPQLAETFHVCNDTIGTFLTVTDEPAIVLISGTGSICKYVRRDLSYERIGGYGYLLGDAGSAYWIAHQMILKFLEIEDGLLEWSPGIETVRHMIYEHFGIKNSHGLLNEFYNKFNKSHVARLCERIVVAARNGDELCLKMLHDSGFQLGRHVMAALKHAIKENPSTSNWTVICCGKVFLSWNLLRTGFCLALTESSQKGNWSGCLNMVQLQLSAGYGAARLAARLNAGLELPIASNASSVLDSLCVSI